LVNTLVKLSFLYTFEEVFRSRGGLEWEESASFAIAALPSRGSSNTRVDEKMRACLSTTAFFLN